MSIFNPKSPSFPMVMTLGFLVVIVLFLLALLFVPENAHAQGQPNPGVAHPIPFDKDQGALDFLSEPFPISNMVRNADNLPIYRIECNNGTCVGPTGEPVGSERDVASEMPILPKELTVGHGYICHEVCWDKDGNIIGANPMKYIPR
jgi:hypothetical protein